MKTNSLSTDNQKVIIQIMKFNEIIIVKELFKTTLTLLEYLIVTIMLIK